MRLYVMYLATMIVIPRSRMLDDHPRPYRTLRCNASTGESLWREYLKRRIVHFCFTIPPPTRVESYTHKMNPPQLNRDYLTDGYISYTFTSRNAEFYVVHLFRRDAASVQAIRDRNGVYSVFIPPSHFSPPTRTPYGDTWVLDHAVRNGGSVVPQQLWAPQGQGDRRRYVDQAQFRMPIFFVNRNGSLGVPVMHAAAGHMQLRDAYLPPSLMDKTTAKIRIGWPGYAPSEQQVQLRDQTPAKNPIPFDRFVKHVGSRVRQFLTDRERLPVQQAFRWMVGHGNIISDEVMLIGIVQVSEGSWMPILQLMTRVVM